MFDNFRLPVLHEKYLEDLIVVLGIKEKLDRGEIRCHICGRIIDRDNFGGVLREGGKLIIICDNIECVSKAVKGVRNVGVE